MSSLLLLLLTHSVHRNRILINRTSLSVSRLLQLPRVSICLVSDYDYTHKNNNKNYYYYYYYYLHTNLLSYLLTQYIETEYR